MASLADDRPERVRYGAPRAAWRRFARAIGDLMPKGLYARSLIIIIAPIVVLQAVVAFVFMERHWDTVTRRLSAAVVRDIAALAEIVRVYPHEPDFADVERLASQRLALAVTVLPPGPLPPAAPKPFFTLLDQALSREITRQINRPFWIDTVGRSNLVEIRIQLDDHVLRVIAPRSQAYASNSEIFIVWMVAASLVLLTIAVLFLRNQIRPIQRLAAAAEAFGKGRPVEPFRPRGAREVRQAAAAFNEMRERIERQMEQRTAMLAGVSHDLRTVLTRFRLQLAFLAEGPDTDALKRDVDDMQKMVEGYLAFARGDAGERPEVIDLRVLIEEVVRDTAATGAAVAWRYAGDPEVRLRPQGFKRCLGNLSANAARHGSRVEISARHADGWVDIAVEDDGPGIPAEEFEAVFRPFYRLDEARNIDQGGTGLGLSIALDIARVHGGGITLDRSPMGGLRATIRIPG